MSSSSFSGKLLIFFIGIYLQIPTAITLEESCMSDTCNQDSHNKYSKELNNWSTRLLNTINDAVNKYVPCESQNCSCHQNVIEADLKVFKKGITKEQFLRACAKGTKYQIIDGQLYREENCHFPARCAGIEHYLKLLSKEMPNLELAINTRDWPQYNRLWGHEPTPIFSFSKAACVVHKSGQQAQSSLFQLHRLIYFPLAHFFLDETKDFYDIMYPAWSFWEGGPAISLYPTGIGRWDKHRVSISTTAKKWSWETKKEIALFRGSRTSEERDPLVLLSRSNPDLVDAQYTKNQAWKSDADTLFAAPASEISFEDHCKFKYLFNYRGVAASFRLKHLFLCKSLVFHVGEDWLEFFYPSLIPWVHYVPISPKATQEEIRKYIEFFKDNDELAKYIAKRGYEHVWDNLRDQDVVCYWRKLLNNYSELLDYKVTLDKKLHKVR